MKTSELTGAALDWAVAKCLNTCVSEDDLIKLVKTMPKSYAYSIDWSQGGPLIARGGISVQTDPSGPNEPATSQWSAYLRQFLFGPGNADCFMLGPTPLIAAMRCYVSSELGDEIEIPEELL